MSEEESPSDDGWKGLCTLWAASKPTRHDYAAVVNEINSLKLVGEASVIDRGPHVPITHLSFFKAAVDAFATDLKSKDRRSAKEWDYINGAGVWLESGIAALRMAREGTGNAAECGRQLALSDDFLQASFEVLSMRSQYFRDINKNGIEEARQMAFLVEQGRDAVHSNAYRSARDVLSGKLEVEAAKQLAKSRLERATKKSGKTTKKKGGASDAAESE